MTRLRRPSDWRLQQLADEAVQRLLAHATTRGWPTDSARYRAEHQRRQRVAMQQRERDLQGRLFA